MDEKERLIVDQRIRRNPEWPKVRLVEGVLERVRDDESVVEYWDGRAWRPETSQLPL